jgi:hypothetical protein
VYKRQNLGYVTEKVGTGGKRGDGPVHIWPEPEDWRDHGSQRPVVFRNVGKAQAANRLWTSEQQQAIDALFTVGWWHRKDSPLPGLMGRVRPSSGNLRTRTYDDVRRLHTARMQLDCAPRVCVAADEVRGC